MKKHCLWQVMLILVLCRVFISSPTVTFASEQNEQIGIILLHGKTGQPERVGKEVVEPLKQAGFLVEVPEMPWSKQRYIDKSYEDALYEIDQVVVKLKARGATRIVIAGHSMGANAALAYAAYRGNIAGIVLLAPGHIPDFPALQRKYGEGVARAKAMMDAGHGNDIATFDDNNNGKEYIRKMKAAQYYSFFNPEGMGAVSKSAKMISPAIAVLYVAGSQDPLTQRLGREFIFNKLSTNTMTKYVIVDADHTGTPIAAVSEMITWLNLLK